MINLELMGTEPASKFIRIGLQVAKDGNEIWLSGLQKYR